MRYPAVFIIAAIIFASCNQISGYSNSGGNEKSGYDSAALTTIEWKETSIDFGKIPEGRKLDIAYHFKNSGSRPLIISSVEPGCGCTVAETPDEPVAPGKEGIIKANFDSNGRFGTQHKSIYVFANTKGTLRHELLFQADVQKKN